MQDKYADFASLARSESDGSFAVRIRDLATHAIIVALHGGGIEPGTSEIALAVAGPDLSYYVFEGLKSGGNADLHISSARFDEPRCLEMVSRARLVVAIHGEASDTPAVFLGGGDEGLQSRLRATLEEAGFSVRCHPDPRLQGSHPRNICNLGSARAGVQLELGLGLRRQLFRSLDRRGRTQPSPSLARFASAVRRALPVSGA